MPEHNLKPKDLWVVCLIASLTLIFCTFLAMNTLKTIKMKNGSIVVKGYAQKPLVSDHTLWQIRIKVRAENLVQAYTQLEQNQEKILAFLINSGIEKHLITPSAVQADLIYKRTPEGHPTNAIETYELSQTYGISSHDVRLIERISQEISSLMKEEIHLLSFAPQYFYTKMDEVKIAMLGEAAKDAKLRAEQLVVHNTSKVGQLLSAHQGVFQITPVYSNMSSDYGENDTSSIEKTIKAIVTIEYAIQ